MDLPTLLVLIGTILAVLALLPVRQLAPQAVRLLAVAVLLIGLGVLLALLGAPTDLQAH